MESSNHEKAKQSKLGSKTKLSFIYTNADNILNKRNELLQVVSNEQPDIICITEFLPKHTTGTITESELQIPGYTSYTNLNDPECHRGVLAYIKENLTVNPINFTNHCKESLCFEIKSAKSKKSLLVACIYRSPNSTENNDLQVNNLICELSNSFKKEVVLVGDFNFPEIDWENVSAGGSNKSSRFINSIETSLLVQNVNKYTHSRPNQRSTLIDLIFTYAKNDISDIIHMAPLGKSHHNLLKFNYYLEIDTKSNSNYLFHKGNYNEMRNQLSTINWFNLLNEKSIDDSWNIFQSIIENLVRKFIPNVDSSKQSKKRSLWMNKTAFAKVKKKTQMYHRYLQTKDGIDYLNYTRARNQAKSSCRKAMIEFEKSIAKQAKSNPKAFYRYAKSKTVTKSNIPDLKKDEVTLSEAFDKAEAFNSFFASVFTKENNIIPDFENRSNCELSTINLTEEIVRKKLSSLKTNKSPGVDGLHPKVLSELSNEICTPLFIIFKQSITQGLVPRQWKDAVVVPLHKKGSKASTENYRPISLTSICCKLLESIIKDNLMEFMNDNNLISPSQFGFVPKKSCLSNLLTMLDKWTQSLDDGYNVDAIYLDLAKAFDSVPHQKLLHKLDKYGIKGDLLKWIKSFLEDRRQCVRVDGMLSNWLPVTSGVPQGSVLGPILFVLYINDLPDEIKSLLLLFADDTKLFNSIINETSTLSLQDDINALFDWSCQWQLKFNPTKCKVLHVGRTNHGQEYYIQSYDGEVNELSLLGNDKDLGVIVDPCLKFTNHVNFQVRKAYQILGIIRRSYTYIDHDSFKYLFTSLIRPHLEYCNCVWYPMLKKDLDAIEGVLRKSSRYVNGMSNKSYDERLSILNMPSMKYRFLRGDMIHTYKIVSDSQNSLHHLFNFSTESITRGHDLKLFKPLCNTNVRSHFFSLRVINDWNNLPADVVNAPSVNAFKNKLDQHWHDKKFIY